MSYLDKLLDCIEEELINVIHTSTNHAGKLKGSDLEAIFLGSRLKSSFQKGYLFHVEANQTDRSHYELNG